MSFESFKNLDLLPELLEKLVFLEDKIKLLERNLIKTPDLTKRKNVREYLEISESTLNNMFKDGRLKIGVHYHRTMEKGKIRVIFNSEAIKKLAS